MNESVEQHTQMILEKFGVLSYYLGSVEGPDPEESSESLRRVSLYSLSHGADWRYCLLRQSFAFENGIERSWNASLKGINQVPFLDYDDFSNRLHRLHPRVLQSLVADLLRSQEMYSEATEECLVNGFPVDIVAIEDRALEEGLRRHFFEVKQSRIATLDLINRVAQQKKIVMGDDENADFTLVIAGRFTADAREGANSISLAVWDLDNLVELFLRTRHSEYLEIKYFGTRVLPVFWRDAAKGRVQPDVIHAFSMDVLDAEGRSHLQLEADTLLRSLQSIKGGKSEWPKYQQLTQKLVEFMFVPPLGRIHYERGDALRRNRRDLIVENWATDGFWAQMRDVYDARLIVVDGKNSAKPLKKKPVIEIAHYLKPHGCGMFGIIFCREGLGEPAIHAIREQWIGGRKLIVALSDEDVEKMIDLKSAGGLPEELLRDKIAAFLMSL